jgi:hypothetical protein
MRRFGSLFIAYYLIFFTPFNSFSQKKDNCLSREYVIEGAQLANQSYTFSKLAYFVNSNSLAIRNVDSAIIYIQWAIIRIDSAMVLASDSELMAINYANIAKKYATRSYKLLKRCTQETNISMKQDIAKQAMFLSANAVTEAYHASFYFKNCKQQKEEKKDTAIARVSKQVTKLDIDQTLFALLDEHLHEKTEEDKNAVTKLTAELKTSKDPVKAEKIKEEIKKLEKEEAQLEQKDKNTKEKLTTINTQIDERNKNNAAPTQPQETVFSKSMKRPADEWDKDIQIDAELPMGLIYQIQIGYYKKLIVSEIFRGLTPIVGKTMPNGGVSYSIGMFEKAADAQQAKAYVKSLGLSDAFVIASYNRKKVTLAEAVKLEKK